MLPLSTHLFSHWTIPLTTVYSQLDIIKTSSDFTRTPIYPQLDVSIITNIFDLALDDLVDKSIAP
jgi:hypothetical protein